MRITGLIAIMLVAAPVQAQVWRVGNDSYHVQLSGLDLATTAGRAEALRRVERAAARLCDGRLRAHDCTTETIAVNVRRNPMLARAANERDAVRLAAR